jgi:hypothetical protein
MARKRAVNSRKAITWDSYPFVHFDVHAPRPRGAATPQKVARWMWGEMRLRGRLRQRTAAVFIRQQFGAEFVYKNRNGNPALRSDVLDAFQEVTGKKVVWMRGSQTWRRRRPNDPPGRMVR